MYKLKLIKGLSYSGVITATKDYPIVNVDDKDLAHEAVKTGYFSLIEEAEMIPPEKEKTLDDMTVKELEAFAAEKEIDLKGCGSKADKLNRILSAIDDDYTEGEEDDI